MEAKNYIAEVLKRGGVKDVYTAPVPSGVCDEPIVITSGSYSKDSDVPGGEHGSITCNVISAKFDEQEAFDIMLLCMDALRDADLADIEIDERIKTCEVDYSFPEYSGHDSSGRSLFKLEVIITIEWRKDYAEA